MKYVKLINGTQLETLTNDKALNYLDETELNADGFKEFIPATREEGKPYRYTYEETETQIIEHATEIIPDPIDILNSAKVAKREENARIRDIKLLAGVTYKNVVFDSDTDQKINLSEQCKRMSDLDTVTWHGMYNDDLVCTKADIEAIGELIYELTAYVWNKDAYIKTLIDEAESIEELEQIEINYNDEE